MLLVVLDQFGRLSADFIEHIVDEAVHDAHGSLRDTCVWVNLLQNSVDVNRISLHGLLMRSFSRRFGTSGFRSIFLVGGALVTFLVGRLLSWHF